MGVLLTVLIVENVRLIDMSVFNYKVSFPTTQLGGRTIGGGDIVFPTASQELGHEGGSISPSSKFGDVWRGHVFWGDTYRDLLCIV